MGVRMRTYYSQHHMEAAVTFTERSHKLESDYDGKKSDYDGKNFQALFNEHRAYVTGAILTTVAFLEATVNELYADFSENHLQRYKLLTTESNAVTFQAVKMIGGMWEIEEFARGALVHSISLI